MAKRFFQSIGVAVAVVLVALALLLKLGRSPVVGQAQAPAAPGGDGREGRPGAKNAMGRAGSAGHLERYLRDSAAAAGPLCRQGVLHRRRAGRAGQAARRPSSSQDVRRYERGSEQDVGGAYATNIFLSHKPTGRRTSLIIDPPDGRIPPLTPEATKRQGRHARVPARAASGDRRLQGQAARLRGWQVRASVAAARRNAAVLSWRLAAAGGGAINRSDGPEDRTLGERCMAAILPDFGGAAGFFPQIIQSPQARSRSSTTPARARGGSE